MIFGNVRPVGIELFAAVGTWDTDLLVEFVGSTLGSAVGIDTAVTTGAVLAICGVLTDRHECTSAVLTCQLVGHPV
jgi:hypothetical protein